MNSIMNPRANIKGRTGVWLGGGGSYLTLFVPFVVVLGGVEGA